MSLNRLRYKAAQRRAFSPTIFSEPLATPPSKSAREQPDPIQNARLVGYNPSADKYVIQTTSGKLLNTTYIPGNNPRSGGFDYRQQGLTAQGFYLG